MKKVFKIKMLVGGVLLSSSSLWAAEQDMDDMNFSFSSNDSEFSQTEEVNGNKESYKVEQHETQKNDEKYSSGEMHGDKNGMPWLSVAWCSFGNDGLSGANQDRVMMERSKKGLFFGVLGGYGENNNGTSITHVVSQKMPYYVQKDGLTEKACENMNISLKETMAEESQNNGCAAIMGFLGPKGKRLKIANIGNARAMVFDANGVFKYMSQDHLASNKDEQERIRALNGILIYNNGWRIGGNKDTLASRSFGYFKLATDGLIAQPDIIELAGKNSMKKGDCILMGSHGFWDTVTESYKGNYDPYVLQDKEKNVIDILALNELGRSIAEKRKSGLSIKEITKELVDKAKDYTFDDVIVLMVEGM